MELFTPKIMRLVKIMHELRIPLTKLQKKKSERRNVLGHARIAWLGQLGQMAHEYQNNRRGTQWICTLQNCFKRLNKVLV